MLLATSAYAEEIADFSAVYTVEPSGEVLVVENITYDFGDEERRGIFRTLENDHPQPASAWYKSRYVDIEVESVLRNEEVEPYEVTGFNTKEIKIGDEDTFISGVHTYTITYRLRGALSYGEDGSELYWNATGNDWEVPISQARIEVVSEAIEGNAACYEGEVGSTARCEMLEGEESVVFFASALTTGEGITIAVELIPDQVSVLMMEKTVNYLSISLQVLFFLGLLVWLVRWYRQDKIDKPVIAQYEPYQNYLPMYTGVLFDKYLHPQDITAGILYLAEQGFLSITKTKKKSLIIFKTTDYDITLLRPLAKVPTQFLTTLTSLLFATDAKVGTVVSISDLAKKPEENYKVTQKLQSDISADIKENGFIKSDNLYSDKRNIFGAIVLALFLAFWSWILLIICVLLVLIFMVVNRRSTKGYEALNHIKGFKLFLSVTEKERYKFFNAPELSPTLFMQYLPYAVALGVEKQWAKVFESITIPTPAWYHGSNTANFGAIALVNDLGTFSSTFSASSGTSGSAGGGASGGGGGGSW